MMKYKSATFHFSILLFLVYIAVLEAIWLYGALNDYKASQSLILGQIEHIELPKHIIYRIAKEQGVDTDMALWVANCESEFIPTAWNKDDPHGGARGIYQIIPYWHDVTMECIYDVECSTRYFIKMVKEDKGDLWTCYELYYGNNIKS